MTISFPSNTRETINAIRDAIGRQITFQTVVTAPCTASGCGVDPITNTAINSFCTVCSGKGYTTTISGDLYTAHITWKPEGILNWIVGGQYYTGDCLVQVEYTDDSIDVINGAKYVVVDDKRLRMKGKILRGVPAINRVLLELELEEE